ncbi:hypothetical protein B296_00025181 [Ensete ventricosum]|uniref:HSF-type DNA-binding domain-containing protein n=1 Tax=Ensete ventricosum TaxID=4639 RepID=A0A427ATE6_ENSVE|nr:hypothetical protein B296_00025181 [Ensete ventricosum]
MMSLELRSFYISEICFRPLDRIEEGGGAMEKCGGDGVAVAETVKAMAGAIPGINGSGPPPFLNKTYDMVDDLATDAIVSWGAGNNSLVVWNTPDFARHLLPKYFKHSNFSSFVRQLNTYGFKKVDPDRWEFANEGFLRGQKQLLKTINRRKPCQSHGRRQPERTPPPDSSVTAGVEVGKLGLEEDIEGLKRGKNVLKQELGRLRQQQLAADDQLETFVKRLEGMEQRQQQMTSFLGKAMRNPAFFTQFLQQGDANLRIHGVNKKRRLPNQGGRIVKYQSLINEAAKAMLRQILKMNTSPRIESWTNSDDLLRHSSSFQSLYEGFESTSRVTLWEVASDSGFDQSSAAAVAKTMETGELTNIGVSSDIAPPTDDLNISDFSELLGVEDPVLLPVAIEKDDFSAHTGINFHDDDDDDDDEEKLPGIVDAFWEQFFTPTSVSGDADDVESSIIQEPKEIEQSTDGGLLHNSQHMVDLLPQQMELLLSSNIMI